jgi:predicted negative regulator of RcsB-dependent stress response
MPRQKVTRKQLLKEPDEFLSTSLRTYRLLKHHSGWVTAGILAIFVAGVGVWGWRIYQERREGQAMAAHAEAYQIYRKAAEQLDEAASKDLMDRAVERFQTVIQRFDGTQAAWMAHLYRGHACYAVRRYDEAIHDYEAALSGASGGAEEIRALAMEGLGYTRMAKGDTDGAMSAFQGLKEQGGPAFQRTAKWNMARCYERLGKVQEALDLFKELERSLLNPLQRELAKFKVLELAAKGKPQ